VTNIQFQSRRHDHTLMTVNRLWQFLARMVKIEQTSSNWRLKMDLAAGATRKRRTCECAICGSTETITEVLTGRAK